MISVELDAKELVGYLEPLPNKLHSALDNIVSTAVLLVERESKPLTPVDTGLLRSSIHTFHGGYLQASVGTWTEYAVYVHENLTARHNVGQAKFLKKGLENATPEINATIDREIKRALL